MGPGRADQEWPTSPPRLVPQSDGYADYMDRSQLGQAGSLAGPTNGSPTGRQGATRKDVGRAPDKSRAAHAGHRKTRRSSGGFDRAGRQRSDRAALGDVAAAGLATLAG